jgi:adenosylcobinamide-GDP ribazoletransferase
MSVILGWTGFWLNLGFIALTALLIWYYKRRVGCITGDMLGAMAEILESGLFLMASMGVAG